VVTNTNSCKAKANTQLHDAERLIASVGGKRGVIFIVNFAIMKKPLVLVWTVVALIGWSSVYSQTGSPIKWMTFEEAVEK
jgi:hypothetical protein